MPTMLETVSSEQAFGVLMEPWECMLIADGDAILGADDLFGLNINDLHAIQKETEGHFGIVRTRPTSNPGLHHTIEELCHNRYCYMAYDRFVIERKQRHIVKRRTKTALNNPSSK
jgi:hypothetical protein